MSHNCSTDLYWEGVSQQPIANDLEMLEDIVLNVCVQRVHTRVQMVEFQLLCASCSCYAKSWYFTLCSSGDSVSLCPAPMQTHKFYQKVQSFFFWSFSFIFQMWIWLLASLYLSPCSQMCTPYSQRPCSMFYIPLYTMYTFALVYIVHMVIWMCWSESQSNHEKGSQMLIIAL